MKKLAYILAIIALIVMCINDVSQHGNGSVFTGCVFLGMAFVALGCMAADTKYLKRSEKNEQGKF